MDINQLMKQAQSMQKQMKEMQQEFASKEFEGKSGGGLVKIVMSGDGKMKKINIDPSLISDDKAMIEDLIVAAHNDAKAKCESESKNTMQNVFGGMNIPSGIM